MCMWAYVRVLRGDGLDFKKKIRGAQQDTTFRAFLCARKRAYVERLFYIIYLEWVCVE